MINNLKEKITCPKCGFVYEHDCYPVADPSVKDKLVDGSVFLAKCPGCGVATRIIYPCLYQDAACGFGVYFVPQTQARSMACEGDLANITEPATITRRLCDDYAEFMEKIRVLENGYDDYVMELYKAYAALSMMNGTQGFTPEKLLFERAEKDVFILTGISGSETRQISVPSALYTQLEAKVMKMPQPAEYVMIDMLWALDTLRRQGSILDAN